MSSILPTIQSPQQLHDMKLDELNQVAEEIRITLCELVSKRAAHFASNLGVVELTLALHSTFDFLHDRLIWDTGHQTYPHKLITGRFDQFQTIRTKQGLMGYPNPEESDYDLFMTGHAGSSLSTVLGLRSGDSILGRNNYSVAVIGDGAFPSGIVMEAINHAAELNSKTLVVLNDNEMSICPGVGGIANYLSKLRSNRMEAGLNQKSIDVLNQIAKLGDPTERLRLQIQEGIKAGLHGGLMFEELGFRYYGPIDGHDIGMIKKYLKMVREIDGPVLLHVMTRKGHGFEPAAQDPVYFHTPAPFDTDGDQVVKRASNHQKAYTHFARDAILDQMGKRPEVTVITAAMCQGNKLEPIREKFPNRFFDVGICESHAVAFAAGQCKSGLRPIVDIYSTFLQRSYDQIFQEVCLQKLPVTFMLDRGGLTANDGPTHHGIFDFAYMRAFPNMVVMAPGDANEIGSMLDFSLRHETACSIRYPKTDAEEIQRELRPIELGKSETIRSGTDGTIIACGTVLKAALDAAENLANEGIDLGVVNARFVKPIDHDMVRHSLEQSNFVLTVEEAMLMGGFGSAFLEAANELGLDTRQVHRIGIPDQFIEHQDRPEILAVLRLDAQGIAQTCREIGLKVGLKERV
ncbi:MAG: 1-deoxy-D-xylulose-5-phosphate synthase [Planctomycetota bacterium]